MSDQHRMGIPTRRWRKISQRWGRSGLQPGSADTALMAVTLPAGSYTLQLSGQNGASGVGLVEVYVIPQ